LVGGFIVSVKTLLLKETEDAFCGRKDMSLMKALEGMGREEASWRVDEGMPTGEQLVRHVAWSKSWYCHQGFGTAMVIEDASVNDQGDHASVPWEFPCGAAWGLETHVGIEGAIRLVEAAQGVLVGCLEVCSEEKLGQPIGTWHGREAAAHFFWVMAMHDAYHAGTIRARRTVWRGLNH
jgi:hypothetical protein